MYLKHKVSGSLVEILDVAALCDPCRETVPGRYHAGEELQEPTDFSKQELDFPSGEALPRSWVDRHYKLSV
ncbi:MAG: acetyltransferase [Gammaproteobacteria bacterium]|jgi:hypothetical protein